MSQSPEKQAPTSALAVVALVCVFLCFPLGVILSIIALVRIEGSKGALGGKTLAIIALALSVGAVPIIGILAAIAIPNFVKFQCKSKQSEAKSNLKSLYVSEQAFFAEKNVYTQDLAAAGFQPMGVQIRYQYVVTEAGPQAFRAEARATAPELRGDTWVIDQTGAVQSVQDGCR